VGLSTLDALEYLDLRANSISNIDEVQNITIENIRTILTRIGFNSKMIFLGDTKQIDYKNKKNSALKFIMEQFEHLDEIGTIELTEEDVVRNPLIKKIEAIFNNLENAKQ
jgi:phosphate starvation-inducible PhoH-like protein